MPEEAKKVVYSFKEITIEIRQICHCYLRAYAARGWGFRTLKSKGMCGRQFLIGMN